MPRPPVDPTQEELREKRRSIWQSRWGKEDFAPEWAGREIPVEVRAAISNSWLPKAGRVLDVGCGLGDLAAWFSQHGYTSVGIDIAEAAILKARQRHAEKSPAPVFLATDICAEVPEGGPFDILIDRGCLHGIPENLIPDYLANIKASSSPHARMLLFMRIFRGSRFIDRLGFLKALERRRHEKRVRAIFEGHFHIEQVQLADLTGPGAKETMPGIVYYLVRQ